MAQTISLLLSTRDRADLRGVIEDRGRPAKHVERSRIVMFSAERLPVLEIAKRVGVSRPMVRRWQRRYAEEGLDGLLRHQPLHHRRQQNAKAFRLDGVCQDNQNETRFEPSV